MSIRQVYSSAPGAIPGMQGVGSLVPPIGQQYAHAPGSIPGMQGLGFMISTGGGAPHEATATEKAVVFACVVGGIGLLIWLIMKGTEQAVSHAQMVDRMAERDPGKALGYQAGEMGLAILGRAAMRRNPNRRRRRRARR